MKNVDCYCDCKITGHIFPVKAIYFPLSSNKGKDVLLDNGAVEEWRAIHQVTLHIAYEVDGHTTYYEFRT